MRVMMADATIKIVWDSAEMLAMIAEVKELLENPSDRTRELIQPFLHILNTGCEITRFYFDEAPTDTGEFRAVLQPSDAFRKLVATLRAG